jgi:hypothetical protein
MTQQQKDVFAQRSFKRLRDFEILDIVGRAINITEVVCWQALSELRSRYPSKRAWGEFIQKHKENPDSPFWSISDSTLKRSVRCGRLANQLKIADFSSLKILPSAFDLLTPIKDEKTVERIFHRIKDKNMPIKDVQKIIDELVVATIPEESKQIDFTTQHYDHLFAPRLMIDVIGGGNHSGDDNEMVQVDEKEVIESQETILEDEVADVGNVPDEVVIDDDEEAIELPSFTRQLTHDEMVAAVDRLITSFNIPMVEQYAVIDAYKRLIASRKYPRRA